ncbi:MAG: hypothetical protein ACRDZO_12725 [Egibacteraceae bacterium]
MNISPALTPPKPTSGVQGRRPIGLREAAVHQLFEGHDWPWTTLGEIAELKGGVTKDSKRQHDHSFVEVPYLRVANVQRGCLDLREVATIRVAPEKAKLLRLQYGDVLLNEGGDRDKLGRGWVWQGLRGDDAATVGLLLEAERRSAEEVRYSVMARTLVRACLGRERKSRTPALRGLAHRLGITD